MKFTSFDCFYEWKYVLAEDHQTPIPEPDLLKWGEWYQNMQNRRVAYDEIGKFQVSTVFLGIDHGFTFRPDAIPVLWETMIFGARGTDLEHYQERYSSHDAALEGHQRAVELVKQELKV